MYRRFQAPEQLVRYARTCFTRQVRNSDDISEHRRDQEGPYQDGLFSKKRYLVFGAIAAFVIGILLVLGLLSGTAGSQEFPMSYMVGVFISFGLAIALFAESCE